MPSFTDQRIRNKLSKAEAEISTVGEVIVQQIDIIDEIVKGTSECTKKVDSSLIGHLGFIKLLAKKMHIGLAKGWHRGFFGIDYYSVDRLEKIIDDLDESKNMLEDAVGRKDDFQMFYETILNRVKSAHLEFIEVREDFKTTVRT